MVRQRSELIQEIEDLVHNLERQPSGDFDAFLSELVAGAVRSVPRAQHAGITLAGDGTVTTAASTGPYPVLLDEVQHRHAEGPCVSGPFHHDVIIIDNVASETRWPAYTFEALTRTPIRAVASFQLFTEPPRIGALNVFAEQPGAFDADAIELGLIYATHAALVWSLARREPQFRSALASRDIIGQAKGMLMERFKIDAVQAFEMLKRLSQNDNVALVVVAQRLADAEQLKH